MQNRVKITRDCRNLVFLKRLLLIENICHPNNLSTISNKGDKIVAKVEITGTCNPVIIE